MNLNLSKKIKSVIPQIIWNPIFINVYKTSNSVKQLIINSKIHNTHKWIDVGCGLRPYEDFFPKDTYVGVDVEVSGAKNSMKTPDYFYDGLNLPFETESVDGVISTQVLEHVPNPRLLITEMSRIIKPNGSIILSIPFVWQEHETPFDFSRFSSFGITELLNNAGFEIEEIIKDTSSIETIAILLNVYILNNLTPKIPGIGFVFNFIFCFPIQLIALFLKFILPDKGSLYLNLIVKAKKL
jgi:SAM-dependent methyltransferase